MDSRTLQSSPESGARAGYDGAQRTRGSKAHLAVDTLGHLLAVRVTAAGWHFLAFARLMLKHFGATIAVVFYSNKREDDEEGGITPESNSIVLGSPISKPGAVIA